VRELRDRHCILIIFLVTVALFRKSLFNSQVILSHPIFLDLTHHIYAWRLFGFDLLRRGMIPLWNPYLFCGAPFVANWHSALFYPPNLIFLLIPVHIALNYSIAFHFFLTGALTYAFVRYLLRDRFSALVSALTFIFSGPYLVQLFPGHIFNPLPWFPLALLLAEMALRRRQMIYYLLGGCVLAIQILAGHPQYMIYCLGALVLYLVFRALVDCHDAGGISPLGYMCAGLVIILIVGIALSAIQLFPSWEFKDQSARALLRTPTAVSDVSFPPENIITLLVPGFFGDMHAVRYWGRWLLWETCAYVGILPLVLALIGSLFIRNRYTWFFSGLALFSLLLAFGAYSPLFKILYYHVPGFTLFRGQAKFICLTAFSLSVLAGYGSLCLTRIREITRARLIAAGSVTLLLAVLLISLGAAAAMRGGADSFLWREVVQYRMARGFEGTPPLHPADRQLLQRAYRVALHGVVFAGCGMGLAAIVIFMAAQASVSPVVIRVLIIFMTVGDLWYYGAKYIMTSPLATCRWPREIAGFFTGDRSTYRVMSPQIAVPGANQNMNEGIYAIDGYETTNVGVYKGYVDSSQGVSSETQLSFSINTVTPMLEALGVRYLILPADQLFTRAGYRRAYTWNGIHIYEREKPLPRAYAVHEVRVIPDSRKIFPALQREDFDFSRTVILEKKPGIVLNEQAVKGPAPQVEIMSSLPHEVVIRAALSNAGVLVLSDVYYPGWMAHVDGHPREILRANYAFRAVALEAGAHTVTFRYEPRSFTCGARVSLGAIVLLALYFISVAITSCRGRRSFS